MEFQGRISKLLPMRSGTSARTGNEWKALPFVFEYFEHDTDRFADSVMLETFDTKVIDNLKEGMEVRCGFGHKTREFTKQDGTTAVINDLRLYKIESVRKANAQQPAPQDAGARMQQMLHNDQVRVEQQYQQQQQQQDDDLPF